jgi:hypothetical protein
MPVLACDLPGLGRFCNALPGIDNVIKVNRDALMNAPATLGNYMTVKEAAAFLGVCPGTLRNWDRLGKLRPARHPINGYRLYSRPELEAILRTVAGKSVADRTVP